MGDFNSKIGRGNRGYEEIMGHQGLGEMNDYRERFANLCATSNLRKLLPLQKDTQADLGITRPVDGEPE